jgi:putative endonuclease
MKKHNKQIGKLGEDLAAEYLQKQGYEILARNWGNKWGEIDIICREHPGVHHPRGDKLITPGVVVFVEVKTKTGTAFGGPHEMVDSRKLFQIRRIAALYPAGINQSKRIDVVAVVLDREKTPLFLNHYQAVY